MSVQYRFANVDEIGNLARLVSHSFPGPARPTSWPEQLQHPLYGGGAETLLVAEDNGLPVGALQLHPLHQWIGGEKLPVAGVGSVAISPVHRRRRLAGELMNAALHAGRERGDLASALYPFRVAFYQKMGYGKAGEALQYQVSPEALPDSEERTRVVLLESDADRKAALDLYSKWIKTQNGQLERSAKLWLHLCTDPDRVLVGYRDAAGKLAGYALGTYHTSWPRRYLEVDELVWQTIDARHGLYAWLAALSDQWQQIILRALPSHRLGDWIREPRLPHGTAPSWGLWAPSATLMMGPMFRLLDVGAAWERRRVAKKAALTVAFVVTDEQIIENRGHWRLRFEKGRVSVDREDDVEFSIRTDISTLSRLYIAALSPAEALDAGLIECDRPELLQPLGAALALPEPWMFDRF